MKNLWIICLLGIIGISISSCDEDCEDVTNPICPNYNPCHDVQSIEAKIEMGMDNYQGPTSPSIRFEGDTVIHGSSVYFRTNIDDAVSYKWTIGSDTRVWEEQEFMLNFSHADSISLRNNPLLVTLIMEYESKECFPNQVLTDTISKYLHFHGIWESAIFGTWEGYLDEEINNPYQLRFVWATDIQFGGLDSTLFIYNLYGEGEDCFHYTSSIGNIGYRNHYTNWQTSSYNWETCGGPYYRFHWNFDVAVNTLNETILIEWNEWKYKDNGDCCDTIPHIFRGHRID